MVYEGFQSTSANHIDDNLETLLMSKQQEFNSRMRIVNQLSYELETKKNQGNDYTAETTALQEELNQNVYPIISTLTALQHKYDAHAQLSRDNFNEDNILWSTTDEIQTTNQKIEEQQQKFNSLQQLSKQSLEQYRYQNNIMWMNILFLILLLGAVGYMYYWLNSMNSGSTSFINMPEHPEDILDNDLMHDDEHEHNDDEHEHDDEHYDDDHHHDEANLFGNQNEHEKIQQTQDAPTSEPSNDKQSQSLPDEARDMGDITSSNSSVNNEEQDLKTKSRRSSMSSSFDDSIFDD